MTTTATTAGYADNLDGWIRAVAGRSWRRTASPAAYNGIYRNIMRESSGNPHAINNWDSNAAQRHPVQGPAAGHRPDVPRRTTWPAPRWNTYDPVANITAACNYAAARYGSIDNVFSAY